jgi:hypothetical protein
MEQGCVAQLGAMLYHKDMTRQNIVGQGHTYTVLSLVYNSSLVMHV